MAIVRGYGQTTTGLRRPKYNITALLTPAAWAHDCLEEPAVSQGAVGGRVATGVCLHRQAGHTQWAAIRSNQTGQTCPPMWRVATGVQ